uniref:Uncharacterized protein n=1 Tax=Canis lupus familiaris TaxID=9615 RepID=A0A8C0MQI5_CANLF
MHTNISNKHFCRLQKLSGLIGDPSKYIIDLHCSLSFSSFKVHEKSTWKMCISSMGSTGQASSVGGIKYFSDHVAESSAELEQIKSKNLKHNVLQLPLCFKDHFFFILKKYSNGKDISSKISHVITGS